MDSATLQLRACLRGTPASGQDLFPAVVRDETRAPLDPPATGGNDWRVWQLADSAFPTGGFAHSNGLEAALQNGAIPNAAALEDWIEASLTQLGHGSLPFMTAGYADPGRLLELDTLSDCFILNHVANRASRAQGRALVAAARRAFGVLLPGSRPGGLEPDRPCFHLAPTFGAVTRALDVDRASAARLFLFVHLRGAVASAVRLGIAGPMEGQALQHRLGARCERLLTVCLKLTVEDAAQTAPLLEIWQGTQDRLYSRLFQS